MDMLIAIAALLLGGWIGYTMKEKAFAVSWIPAVCGAWLIMLAGDKARGALLGFATGSGFSALLYPIISFAIIWGLITFIALAAQAKAFGGATVMAIACLLAGIGLAALV